MREIKANPLHREFIINKRLIIINNTHQYNAQYKEHKAIHPLFFSGIGYFYMDIIFRAFRPENPAVDTHHCVVEINHQITEKSENKEDININYGRNNPRRIDQYILFYRKEHTEQPKDRCNGFQCYLRSLIFLIRSNK